MDACAVPSAIQTAACQLQGSDLATPHGLRVTDSCSDIGMGNTTNFAAAQKVASSVR